MGIRSYFTLKEYLSLEISHGLILSKPGDQYIISFPRSGNTWMRTMLGVLINPSAEGNPDFTQTRIPGISLSRIQDIRNQSPPRIIKSHTWYRSDISRTVYLVRDGRDVLISLYHFYITRENKKISFADFYTAYSKGHYGQLWHENVESWMIHGKEIMEDDLMIIRFEDLKSDTISVLRATADFLGIPYGDVELTQAKNWSNIDRMRKIETQRKGPIKNKQASFYRGGKTGEWKSYFDSRIEKEFIKQAGNALKLAGYRL